MTTPHLYGLIGHPLGHSFSRDYFTEKFARESISAEYENFDIPTTADFAEAIDRLIHARPTLQGFNVAIPYKQKIIPLLDVLSEEARAIGAVNVVKVIRNTTSTGKPYRLEGYNTDVIGFTRSLKPLLNDSHVRALVLGSGGASKAVCYGLRQLGVTPTVVSRHPTADQLSYKMLNPEIMAQHTVIVNATPLGTYPNTNTCPAISYQNLNERYVCYDLVYNPPVTRFLELAQAAGARICNGLAMLHIQAEEAWNIWENN